MSEAVMEPKTGEGEGGAPVRTTAFNRMAEQLDAAMKGAQLPAAPASPPAEPPKPQPPEPPKPPAETAKPPAPSEPPKPPEPSKANEPEKTDDDLSENPYSRDWKTIRQHLKERRELQVQMEKAKAEREQLVKQLEEAKSKPAPAPAEPPPELNELKSRLESEMKSKAEIEQQLKILALERAPEFKQHYDAKFEAASKQAQAAVPDDKKGVVTDLIKLPPSAYRKQLVSSLMAEMESEYDKAMLTAAIVEMDRTRAERDKALQDNEVNYKRLQELEAKKQVEEQKATEARMEMTVKGVIDAARQKFASFKSIDGNDAHNAFVKRAEERVARFFRGQFTPDEMTMLPVIASEFELVTAQRDKLLTDLEAAQKTIAAYAGSNPQITGGQKREEAKPKGFIARYKEAYPGPE